MEQNSYEWSLINDNISRSDREVLANFCLNGERFTNGKKVKDFEKIWSEWLGVKNSVMVNSGSSANFISIAMVKELVGTGEIIVPPIGWVSDISSVVQLGFKPVFVDIDLKSMSITSENIKRAITKETKAVVLVHCLGFNGIDDDMIKLCKDNNIILIEDCCESHGATYKDKRVGNFGDISLFSFYFGHHITTIEGGIVCVNDERLYDLAKLFRSHGMTREASSELQLQYQKENPNLNPLFTFAVPGFNMRSTEINAVLGIEQMKRIDFNIQKRIKNLQIWIDNLDSEIYFTGFNIRGNSNFALPLILNPNFNYKLKNICELLNNERVEFRLGTAGGGNQALQPYLKKFEYLISNNLDVANYVHSNSLYIGNHTDLEENKIIQLCKKLNDV
jgi:CDP-6-deoxy-D-xylo-4-hexulose-3-dehydrase